MDPATAFIALPSGLRDSLLDEYRQIVANFSEHRWGPSELSAGRFCEVVYSILEGHAAGTYPVSASKPADFVSACRKLEANRSAPRSFQILIPRMLPALYEVRNNRGVGHVGGDVDPNHMDATVAVSMCNWIMAELVRVIHTLPISDAQTLVDVLAERQIPLVWQSGSIKRVLDPEMKIRDQILVLLGATSQKVHVETLREWATYSNKHYFMKMLRDMDVKRQIYFDECGSTAEILPPGTSMLSDLLRKREIKLG